jgi:hypothetical protein
MKGQAGGLAGSNRARHQLSCNTNLLVGFYDRTLQQRFSCLATSLAVKLIRDDVPRFSLFVDQAAADRKVEMHARPRQCGTSAASAFRHRASLPGP